MDGRVLRGCAAGLLVGMVGCVTPQTRSPAELIRDNEKYTKPLKQPTPTPTDSDTARKDKKLKPETLVKLGVLKDQAAEEGDRPQVERDAYRYQARQSYQKALEQDPKYSSAYMALASSYLKTGEREKAQETFARAIKSNPKDASLWFEQGAIFARIKDFPAALDSLTQATKLDPENKQYQKTLGLALARCGYFEEGYDSLRKCMAEEDARFNVARMCKHLQHTDLCQRQLELALKANPDFTPARALLDELGRGTVVSTAKFEEVTKPTETPKPAESQRVAPVIVGGTGAAPAAPIKIGFDGLRD